MLQNIKQTIPQTINTSNTSVNDKLHNIKKNQADHALVFMFSSIGGKFQQPIGMFAAKGATKSMELARLIISAIIAVDKAGAKVAGLVCDGAQTNRGVWKQFGLNGSLENTTNSFPSPGDKERPIFVISDASTPH